MQNAHLKVSRKALSNVSLSLVWYFSLPTMFSFSETEAAIFSNKIYVAIGLSIVYDYTL